MDKLFLALSRTKVSQLLFGCHLYICMLVNVSSAIGSFDLQDIHIQELVISAFGAAGVCVCMCLCVCVCVCVCVHRITDDLLSILSQCL